jgi:hypothetical protein
VKTGIIIGALVVAGWVAVPIAIVAQPDKPDAVGAVQAGPLPTASRAGYPWGTAVPSTDAYTPPPATSAPPKPQVKPTPSPKPPLAVIEEDTLVHVGEDVPAGTYRVPVGVDGDCYWMKSSDAEGQNIIANDIVQGGRPQVTLKSGQWFTSSRCGQWVKK